MDQKPENKRDLAWILRTFLIIALCGSFGAIILVGSVFWHFSHDLPNIITVADYRPALATQVVAVGPLGTAPPSAMAIQPTVIGEFKKQRRFLVPYDRIPQTVVQAFISAEDDKFFEHPGINIASMVRAGIANFRAGHVVQGGSTITQQVAKSLLLTPERSFGRKIKEIILASRIERNLSKQDILYLYLNEIYLGHGAYGVEAASRTYFRKSVSQVSVAEAAILAGMPQAPAAYSPLRNPKRAKERQLYVLHRMVENGYINAQQMTEAATKPLKVYEEEDINNRYAPYYVEHVRRYLAEKYGDKDVYEGGMTVYVPTTPDLSLAAKKSVRDGLEAVDKRVGYRGPITRLKTADEVQSFNESVRLKLVSRKFEYEILSPEGKIDPFGALAPAGITRDEQLLEVGENYPAVVTEIDDKKKFASIQIGEAHATMPFDKMKWARAVHDDKSGQITHSPDPRFPSQIVKRGDAVLVRVLSTSPVVVGLEQEPEIQGAVFSIEARTGYVLAMHGGYDFEKSEFNRAIQALRQPGSAFKPILYSAALERGFTPASIIIDSPIVYQEADSKWKPSNFEEKFYGDTTFRQALIKSRNVPTIKILQSVQVPFLLDYVKRLGFTAQLPSDLSISLGSASVSLMEITKVYSLFPRLGRKVAPIFFTKVMDRDGNVLEEQKPELLPSAVRIPVAQSAQPSPEPTASGEPAPKGLAAVGNAPVVFPSYPPSDDPDQVLDPRVAYVMSHLMKEVVAYGTGHEAQQLGRPAAGKTGTTSDYIDAWFMGFTPYVVTGTWVGFDNHRTIGHLETGARASLPIWLKFMNEAVKPYPSDDFAVPPGIVFASIDQNSGKLAPPNSLKAIKEAFIEGTEPKETSSESGTPNDTDSGEMFKEDLE